MTLQPRYFRNWVSLSSNQEVKKADMEARSFIRHSSRINESFRVRSNRPFSSVACLHTYLTELLVVLFVFGDVAGNPVLNKTNRLQISEQLFSQRLREPCNAYDFVNGQIAYVDMLRLEQEFVSTLKDKAKDMFTSIGDCANLTSIPDSLYYIPSVEQLQVS
ncbi:uncharacterized protein LOC143257360 isoform X5 [Tachypleus tridentatus]|uniref:uncharacterized protein LOC143257360 isoform X5 n=1 Tax=Tachypleus tridentatus TaxID=6853 RepID=UPI003FD53EAA